MPNIGAHLLYTAERAASAHPDLLIGSILPDIDGMFRDYTGKEVVEGLDCYGSREGKKHHHRLDAVFDRLPARRALVHLLRQEMAEATPKAARFGSEAWSDLVFDYSLFQETRAASALFYQVQADLLRGQTLLEQYRPDPEYRRFFLGYFSQGIPERYGSPTYLSSSLADRLQRRTRPVSISEEDIGVLSDGYQQFFVYLGGQAEPMLSMLMQAAVDDRGRCFSEFIPGVSVKVKPVSGVEQYAYFLNEDNPQKFSATSLAARAALWELLPYSVRKGAGEKSLLEEHTYLNSAIPGCSLSGVAKAGVAAAAFAEDRSDIGVDIELIDRSFSAKFIRQQEGWIHGANFERPEIVLLSMKEAVFKASRGGTGSVRATELTAKDVDPGSVIATSCSRTGAQYLVRAVECGRLSIAAAIWQKD